MIYKCKVRWGQLEILFDMQTYIKLGQKLDVLRKYINMK